VDLQAAASAGVWLRAIETEISAAKWEGLWFLVWLEQFQTGHVSMFNIICIKARESKKTDSCDLNSMIFIFLTKII